MLGQIMIFSSNTILVRLVDSYPNANAMTCKDNEWTSLTIICLLTASLDFEYFLGPIHFQ